MTSKQKWALVDALEAIQGQLRELDFYGQAAEDSLERLEGTLIRAQCAEVDRLDHSIQRARGLLRSVFRDLETALRSAIRVTDR